MPIPVVHAYRDDGPMSVLTKWKPRRVECTPTPDHQAIRGQMYVVKYACGNEGCACAISELVCTQLLSKVGVRTLIPCVVTVNPGFAASCNFKSDFPYPIMEGEHFGTTLMEDVEDGPPPSLSDLNSPWELVLLWAADTWVGNIDREKNGNTLLQYAGDGRFHVIASDQSDCFGGTASFCSESFPSGFLKQSSASAPSVLAGAIAAAGGRGAVAEAIRRVQAVVVEIPSVLSTVPTPWWNQSKIQPSSVMGSLRTRAENLQDIIKPADWELPDGVLL
jgi:hypothetical protein